MFTFFTKKRIFWLLKMSIKPFISFEIEFNGKHDLKTLNKNSILYAFSEKSLADLIALDICLEEESLPSPLEIIQNSNLQRFTYLRPPKYNLSAQKAQRFSAYNLEAILDVKDFNPTIIPVSFYWGKHPDKQKSFFKILFSQSWYKGGFLKKIFRVLFHGRSLVIEIQTPLEINALVDQSKKTNDISLVLSRYLRALFRKSKKAVLGPDISHRRTLVNSLSRNIEVRKEINKLSGGNLRLKKKLQKKAYKYANEICSDLNYPIVRLLVRGFNWFWNNRYDGIHLRNIEEIKRISKDNALIFVPCHRSHIDYCALSYILYEQGLMLPQIAAGNNLNLPFIGKVLRGAGAIFMRRSFTNNSLYSIIFFQHIKSLMVRGNTVEFFPEGGRSRSGLSLPARPGLISMVLRSFASMKFGDVKIVPIYIGYEKILEGETYRSEVLGKPKKRESIFDSLKVLKDFNNYLGNAYINFGNPIDLKSYLIQELNEEDFYIDSPLERPSWLKDVTEKLGEGIMQGINSSVAVTSTSLVSLALLTDSKKIMNSQKLKNRINLQIELINRSVIYKNTWIPITDSTEIINKTKNLNLIKLNKVGNTELFNPDAKEMALLSFYKNNIAHLFIFYSAICESLRYSEELPKEEIKRLIELVYPFLKRDFNLNESSDMNSTINKTLEILVDLQLINRLPNGNFQKPNVESHNYEEFVSISNICEPSIKRFYIIMHALWSKNFLNKEDLKTHCIKVSQHLEIIEGMPYPEFSDQIKFDQFIEKMIREKFIRQNSNGDIKVSRITKRIKKDFTNFFDKNFLDIVDS
ncbi:MAG: glycerol-3-phosphate 1-O-acyltransferase PlsB [SAR86 cluster bacterium]|nr:glycerol-3-phosphate 1-O-acyltransferase PlsB [SAR86 cluster bacterium]